ncbi:ribonucleotide reductase [Earliella scabrosa]|nr:ribonucleotide reductase [Earliella scabrosa]KAI0745206.1 ribonucleotide reductase [Earliella scabrosa]
MLYLTDVSPSLRGLTAHCLRRSPRRDIIERPQFAYMRAALAIHGHDLEMVVKTYDALSRGLCSYSAEFMLRAGTTEPLYPPSFIYELTIPDGQQNPNMDEIDDIWATGATMGIGMSAIPAQREGRSVNRGVVATLQLLNSHAKYHNWTYLRDPPLATAYLPIWHGDIMSFIRCHTLNGAEHGQPIDLIMPAVLIPDAFMERLETEGRWTMFDPDDVPLLQASYGQSLTYAYEQYENHVTPIAVLPAEDVWQALCEAQRNTGYPTCVFSCTVNRKSVQTHLGLIRAGNTTGEVSQVSCTNTTPCPPVAYISLEKFVRQSGEYDLDTLHDIARLTVLNCDRMVDMLSYPTTASQRSATRTRALNISAVGLADTFIAFGVSYGSNESRALNIDIFQTLYHGALEMSTELAERSGPYADWRRSPAYRGVLHVDQWPLQGTHSYDFDNLRTRIILHGLRNAVITTQCPQSGPLHAFPYAPGAGPQLTNVLCREVINRSYVEVRRSLVDALREIGMWNAAVRSSIMMTDGSIQHIDGIPSEIMELYRTARDISPNVYLEMASDRAAYIDQSEVMPVDICTEDETILVS